MTSKPIFSRRRRGGLSLRAQAGVTLVELMVGVTIGLLVTAAALGTLAYNRVSSTLISDTISLQQDASTFMRMLGRQLKPAGAVPAVDSPTAVEKFEFQIGYTGLAAAGAPIPISIRGTENGTRDQIEISYSNVASISTLLSDCLGQSHDAATVPEIVSTFRSENDDGTTNGGSILCQGSSAGATPEPILNNVEELQFWYAVRDAAGNVRYFQADAVADWAVVEAVQVCIRLIGTSSNNPTTGVASTGCTGQAVPDDRRIRRVFRQVFTLRNLQSLA